MKKTNYSYVGIAFIILVFGIIFVPRIVDAIKDKSIVKSDRLNKPTDNGKAATNDLAFIEINGKARKVPPFGFVDQNGKTIKNTDFEGKVYVVEFFFTTCPTICPRMNSNLVQIQNSFKDNDDFGIASFTINPEHDTVEILKDYARAYGIDHPNWHLMTGEESQIYKLANEGFNLYTAKDQDAEGGFEHSGNFALIDKNGFIRSRKDASGNPIIYYNGMISEAEKTDEEGQEEQISILKEDIAQLLKE
ncbi:MAG TPA: SCO family protein [Aquaticitalea sp.]|nr:SCO family protein [Aquaticitalea sp.]HNU58331.1 SCO family protein [Aquaticitalea sp.]